MTNALAVRPQNSISPMNLDEDRKALIRRTICPPRTTDLEFEYFIAFAQRVELDPLLKQVWLIPRRQKDETGTWVEKMEPQVAEIGMRARADRLPGYRGTTGDAVFAGDEFLVNAGEGTVTHAYSLEARTKAGNKVIGAWARVEREGRRDTVVFVTFESRVQTFFDREKRQQVPTPFWIKDPAGQIAKCARAEALRRAFPDVFSGVFIAEEMRDEHEEEQPAKPAAAASATDALEERLKKKLGVQKVTLTEPEKKLVAAAAQATEAFSDDELEAAQKTKAEVRRTEPDGTHEPLPRQEKAKAAAATPPAKPEKKEIPITHVRFGKAKGAALADVSGVELEEALSVGRAGVAKAKGSEPWLEGARAGIAAIEAEIKRRESDSPLDAPEPGSEG